MNSVSPSLTVSGQRTVSRLERALTEPGCVILAAALLLFCLGLATIYVADTHYVAGHDGPENALKQLFRAGIGFAAALIVLWIGYQRIARYSYAIFFLTLALLIPLLIARVFDTTLGGVAAPRNGAYRWLHFPGFPLQPSEMMKVAYVLALAWYLRYRSNYRRLGGLMIPLVFSAIPLALILLEPDLGTAMLMVPVLFAMLFAAGARIRHLLVVLAVGVAAAPFAWQQIEGYQRLRFTAVLMQSEQLRRAVIEQPDRFRLLGATPRQAVEWAAGPGYQLVHSKNAIGSGGLIGHGWGDGVYVQRPLLPDRHNDFIFTLIGHQWGFIGCVTVLACYLAIALAGARIASGTTDPFGRLVAVGIVALISTQALISTGMSVGLLPTTGTTLPFVSYGGSSLLFNVISLALLIGVSRHRPFLLSTRPFEFEKQERELKPTVDFDRLDGAASGLPLKAGVNVRSQ